MESEIINIPPAPVENKQSFVYSLWFSWIIIAIIESATSWVVLTLGLASTAAYYLWMVVSYLSPVSFATIYNTLASSEKLFIFNGKLYIDFFAFSILFLVPFIITLVTIYFVEKKLQANRQLVGWKRIGVNLLYLFVISLVMHFFVSSLLASALMI